MPSQLNMAAREAHRDTPSICLLGHISYRQCMWVSVVAWCARVARRGCHSLYSEAWSSLLDLLASTDTSAYSPSIHFLRRRVLRRHRGVDERIDLRGVGDVQQVPGALDDGIRSYAAKRNDPVFFAVDVVNRHRQVVDAWPAVDRANCPAHERGRGLAEHVGEELAVLA